MQNIRSLIARSRFAVAFVQDLATEEFGYVDLGEPPQFSALQSVVAPGRVLFGVVGWNHGAPKTEFVATPPPETAQSLTVAIATHFTNKLLGAVTPEETSL